MATKVLDESTRLDRFGNAFTADLPYARGVILNSGETEHVKLQQARQHIRRWIDARGIDGIFNISGLERSMHLVSGDVVDDELSPAVYDERLRTLAFEHLGGDPAIHDVLLCNRQSAALFASLMVLVRSGGAVVGISPDYSHPSITRPTRLLGGRFIDTHTVESFQAALATADDVSVAVITRLAVSYQLLDAADVDRAAGIAHERGLPVLVDDAGGARVAPAVFGCPRLLGLRVDVGTTGLDKYGTLGPRLGLLGGSKDLVAQVRARAFEYGLEARPMLYPAVVRSLESYREDRVRELAASTTRLADSLEARFGEYVTRTVVSVKLAADDILEMALRRSGLKSPSIVPYEATAAVAMILLRDFGVVSVHFSGLPPGTSALLFKFTPPETLERFGGPDKLASAIDASIEQLAELLHEPGAIRELLLGPV